MNQALTDEWSIKAWIGTLIYLMAFVWFLISSLASFIDECTSLATIPGESSIKSKIGIVLWIVGGSVMFIVGVLPSRFFRWLSK
jgi:hypothetical protein